MRGQHNSVTQWVRVNQPNLLDLHCPCHAAALIASSTSEAVPDYVEQLCRDIYAHFHLSPKRLCAYKELKTLCDTKPHKILKLCQTCWLSAQQVTSQILEQYSTLPVTSIAVVLKLL